MTARYTHFNAACLLGKWPRARTAFRIQVKHPDRVRGAHDPADLAIEVEERHELGPNVLLCRMIAGYLAPHASANSRNRSSASASVAAW
jgi:hypothetical protein